jgi:hypothetical protein
MSESFAALFEESLKRTEMRPGEVITAEVVRIEHNFVVVNAGLKSEAYVPLEEFKSDLGEIEVQVGDFVSVAIGSIENGYGDTILSRDTAKRLASWLSLEKALESGEFVTGTTSGKSKAASLFWSTAFVLSCQVHWLTHVLPKTSHRTKTRPWNSRSSSWTASATTSCCHAVLWSKLRWAKSAPN